MTARPELPRAWEGISSEKLLDQCPKISGEFELIPGVLESENGKDWGKEQQGDEGDFDNLFSPPLVTRKPLDEQGRVNNRFRIEQAEPTVWALSWVYAYDPEVVFRSNFGAAALDYKCDSGEMILPEYKFEGGSEGVSFNDLILYSLFVNSSGDIIFYEQKHKGRKSIRHRYYRFSKVE